MPKNGRSATAAEMLGAALAEQAADLRAQDVRLRTEGGSPHLYRTAARRLRSTLAGYGPLLRGEDVRRLGAGLAAASASMGDARDAEVVRARIEIALAGEPAREVAAVRSLLRELTPASPSVTDHLVTEDYDHTLRLLDRVSDLPPWRPAAQGPAEATLLPLLDQEWRRFRDRARAALAASQVDRVETQHEARKAAKRARYVLQVAEPVCGRRARKPAKAAARVQTALGEHRDGVLAQELLGRAVTEATRRGEPTGLLARLLEHETALLVELAAEADRRLGAVGERSSGSA